MANPQLVRIPTLGKDNAPLPKAQKEFNRLTKKVEELEAELTQFRTATTHIQQRVRTEYEPLLRAYNQQRAALVRVFDRAHDRPDATKAERKKLADLILNMAYSLISEYGMDELKPIVNKYDADGYDATDAETDVQVSEAMKEMVSSMYGIEFNEKADVSTQEKFIAYLREQMQARQEEDEKRKQEAAERRAKKPRSAKQQAREEKKQLEEHNTTKAVRTLYMDLVKAFHPDREPDEAEKARKTEIMQRVTQAYETSDLLALLRLQLEFNRIDQQHLETLAEEQLKYYNKILRQQADELANKLIGLKNQLAAMMNKPLTLINSVPGLEFSFNNELRELKRATKATKKDANDLSDPAQMKAFLKTYRIQEATDIDPFFGAIFG